MNFENLEVLILEDSPSAMMDLVAKLPREVKRDNVFKAFNYQEAEDILVKKRINTALLDLSMPKKNGMDLIMNLKSNKKTKDMQIIVTTGVDNNSLLLKVLKKMKIKYLRKPVDPIKLKQFISLE